MTSSGLAMKMKLELAALARCIAPSRSCSCALPLHDPSPRPVMISGIASACIDQERMKFRPWSLVYLPWKSPLLFRHRYFG